MLMNLLGDVTENEPIYILAGWDEEEYKKLYRAIWKLNDETLIHALKVAEKTKRLSLNISDRETIQAAAEVLDSCTVEQGVILGMLINIETKKFLEMLTEMNNLILENKLDNPLEPFILLQSNVTAMYAQGLDPIPLRIDLRHGGVDPLLN